MTELNELYQEMVMDHYNRPRNLRKLEGADASAEGFNPFCGDIVTIYLKFEGDTISDIAFESTGCAISRASASMMTESVKGKSKDEAQATFELVRQMLTRGLEDDFDTDSLGDLEVLSGVAQFPVRVKCASLSWHTLRSALLGNREKVSTE